MHFGLERAARAAEVEAPASTTIPKAVHRQQIPCPMSEILSACDNQMALISERRSMPCLHQPVSKPSKRGQSSNDGSIIERSVSPISTISSRRSVSSMKQLLPLRLRATPPQPKIDLAFWLDSTVPNIQTPIALPLENEPSEELTAYSPIPWISSSQDVRLSCNLSPDRFRETPIYSGPGSPILSRAYYSNEEPCYHYSSRGSVCDDLCIASEYKNADISSPYIQEPLVDYADACEVSRNGSIAKSATSFASSQISRPSTGCHGEYVPPDEATWMRSNLCSWNGGGLRKTASEDGIFEAREEENLFEGWLDSESSRSSSSFSNDEVLDALVTKLAPAKAHIVELNKALHALPALTDPPISNLQVRPATPYRLQRRRNKPINYPMLKSKEISYDRRLGPRQYQRAMPDPSSLLDQQWKHSVRRSSFSPIASTSSSIYEERNPEHGCPDVELDAVESSKVIIASINDVVQGFPQQMLFLDTPCVVDIRRQNHLARHINDSRGSSNPPSNSSTYSLSLDRQSPPTSRRRTANSFFAPFLRATTRKSTFLHRKAPSSYGVRPSSCISTGWRSLASKPDIPPPELSIFRHIFPGTQDWWRSVLYAHLIAFNYVRENNVPEQRNTPDYPSKACRTLGISYGRSPIPDPNTGSAQLEETLVLCITWVTNCMTGNNNTQKDIRKGHSGYERDYVLVRALAEIVKVCERGGGGEGNLPQDH